MYDYCYCVGGENSGRAKGDELGEAVCKIVCELWILLYESLELGM